MEMIELVIKIPKEIYEASQILDAKYEDTIQIPLEVIKNGKPLPKGHGRLIDADYAIKQLLSLPKNELSIEDMWAMEVLDLVPTILEATKE